MLEDQRRPVVAGQVLVAPAHQGDDDGIQVAARVGQVVLEAGRVLGVRPALQDPGADQGAQAGGQRVARRPGAAHHLVEPAVAEEDLADGQQGPLLADDVQGAGDRAGPRLGRLLMIRILPHQLVFWTHWVMVGPDFGLTPEESSVSSTPPVLTLGRGDRRGRRAVAGGVHVEPGPVHRQPGLPVHQQAVPGDQPELAVLGAQRVHDRVRGGAGARRAVGGPDRAAPDVRGRAGRVHCRVGAVRAGAGRGPADRGAGRPGGRGGGDGARVAVAAAGRGPGGRPGRRRWAPGRRWARWGRRSAR